MSGKSATAPQCFNPRCRRCQRLSQFLGKVRHTHPDYHAAPVRSFGDSRARLLIIGLAPGLHGANRTGRPFTGDDAGRLLFATLHRLGLSSSAESRDCNDELRLLGCRITNAVKCLPPANRPNAAEIRQCNGYLRAEIDQLPDHGVLFALGRVAHDAALRTYDFRNTGNTDRPGDRRFVHGSVHRLPGAQVLVDSYHPSRYNVNTGRLTEPMFVQALRTAAALAGLI